MVVESTVSALISPAPIDLEKSVWRHRSRWPVGRGRARLVLVAALRQGSGHEVGRVPQIACGIE